MKTNRSEYLINQAIIEGFKPRYMVSAPKGKTKALNNIVWLLVGFCIPPAMVGASSHYNKTQCHNKALSVAGNVGTDHYYSVLENCSK